MDVLHAGLAGNDAADVPEFLTALFESGSYFGQVARRHNQQHPESHIECAHHVVVWHVAAFGDYGSTGLQIDSARPTRQYGIELKVPVFDGFRRDARRAESASQYQQEKIRLRDLEQQVELEVREALDSLRSAQAELEAARDGLMLAENELAQAQRRYQAGVTNSIEVTDAQTRLDRARDNQIAALYDYNLARIDLATGRIEELR